MADIRVEGLQRITPAACLPRTHRVGDVVDGASVRSISRNLFYTGNFDDISVGRDGNVLVLLSLSDPALAKLPSTVTRPSKPRHYLTV